MIAIFAALLIAVGVGGMAISFLVMGSPNGNGLSPSN